MMKADRAAGSLNRIIQSNKYLRRDTEVRSYKVTVKPVLIFGHGAEYRYKENESSSPERKNKSSAKNYRENKHRPNIQREFTRGLNVAQMCKPIKYRRQQWNETSKFQEWTL